MMKKLSALLLFAFCLCLAAASAHAAANDNAWYWLSSDDKYSKYIDLHSVKVTKKAVTSHGDVATEIEGWTKTTYSYEGAAEAIANYELKDLIPDPARLSYSLAEVRVKPQNRTLQYLQENFYDQDNKVIWSRAQGREKEINSQEFDEMFYNAIVDRVFRMGEIARAAAKDRWIVLWESHGTDGSTTHVTADTTTMRRRGDNLIYWEWYEHKNPSGKVVEIKFMKKNVNLPSGTEQVSVARSWTSKNGWQDLEDDTGGAYRLINETSPDYKGLVRLRAFADGYSTWVNRYSLD